MKLADAQQKVIRIVGTVERGKLPYRVIRAVLYGSAAKQDPNPHDVDVYLELDRSTVPEDDIWRELTHASGSVSTKLNKVLKLRNGERVSIQWGTEPWENHRMKFIKPGEVESRLKDRMSELDLSLKSHAEAKRRMEKAVEKRRDKPIEWPPFGVTIYPRDKTEIRIENHGKG